MPTRGADGLSRSPDKGPATGSGRGADGRPARPIGRSQRGPDLPDLLLAGSQCPVAELTDVQHLGVQTGLLSSKR
jgi:hypothetical protein